MGLIDFIANAGQALLGSSEPSPEEKSQKLEEEIQKLGLEAQGVKVVVEGDTAVITGVAKSQSEKEKIILAVGNTEGVAKVDDRMEVETPEPEAVYYTVVKGDTLSGIAKTQYGAASKYMVIFEANKPMLKDPDLIYPGQVLRIPPLNDA